MESGLKDYASPDNPVPEGGIVLRLTAVDGVRLRAARWPTSKFWGDDPRGTVTILQGRAECIEKYFETIDQLRARGFEVLALDWRGQGLSERELANPRKGHIDDFALYERDVFALRDQMLFDRPKPWFALAHSMGAAVALAMARARACPFERIVATAPMIEIGKIKHLDLARFMVEALDILGQGTLFVPGGGETPSMTKPFLGNDLTTDPRRHKRNADILAAHPELAVGDPTIGWMNAALRMTKTLNAPEHARSVNIPVLALASDRDRVTSTPAAARYMAGMKAGRLIVLHGAEHEILQERDAILDQFWAAFDAFIPGRSADVSS